MRALPILGISLLMSVCMLNAQSFEKGYEQVNVVSVSTTPSYKTDLENYYLNYRNTIAGEFDGGYQFIITGNTRMIITSETLEMIAKNRDKLNEKTIELSSNIKVRILSLTQLKSKSIIPIDQLFILE